MKCIQIGGVDEDNGGGQCWGPVTEAGGTPHRTDALSGIGVGGKVANLNKTIRRAHAPMTLMTTTCIHFVINCDQNYLLFAFAHSMESTDLSGFQVDMPLARTIRTSVCFSIFRFAFLVFVSALFVCITVFF